jgi:molybdenum cofactor cytidylyltransferase
MIGPIVGILLAAGKGDRFGGGKLLSTLPDGLPIALAAARNLQPACDRLLVVLRPGDTALADLLTADGFAVMVCHDAEAGMGHSLAAGVRASPEAGAWIVALADMPYIQSTSHHGVAARLRAGDSLVATKFQGRRGHPVGFSGRWRDQLSVLTGDQGGKAILEQHPDELNLIAVDDPGVVRDVDRPEDLGSGFRVA